MRVCVRTHARVCICASACPVCVCVCVCVCACARACDAHAVINTAVKATPQRVELLPFASQPSIHGPISNQSATTNGHTGCCLLTKTVSARKKERKKVFLAQLAVQQI